MEENLKQQKNAKEKYMGGYMDHHAPNYTRRPAHTAPRQDTLFASIIFSSKLVDKRKSKRNYV
jgi:hypothetical protein